MCGREHLLITQAHQETGLLPLLRVLAGVPLTGQGTPAVEDGAK